MGIALFTLPALQNPLRGLKRLLSHKKRTNAPTDHLPSTALASLLPSDHNTDSGGHGAANSGAASSEGAPRQRPLRGNWPFTVRPPVRTPEVPAGQPATANRSFLPMPSMGSSRQAFLASLAADASPHRSNKTLRRVSDARTGRLVIAGRMADVCAELDRMAASEALQA